jgi:hypothetical protein
MRQKSQTYFYTTISDKKLIGFGILALITSVAYYKYFLYISFSGEGNIAKEYTTFYGGIKTGEYSEYIQTKKETCGHSVLAFFLSSIGIQETEKSITEYIGKDTMLSLADIEKVIISRGYFTQILKVTPQYFKKHPETSILHFSSNHFVLFLWEEQGEAVIFDPEYGKVYVAWQKLSKLFSGYMLYVYER